MGKPWHMESLWTLNFGNKKSRTSEWITEHQMTELAGGVSWRRWKMQKWSRTLGRGSGVRIERMERMILGRWQPSSRPQLLPSITEISDGETRPEPRTVNRYCIVVDKFLTTELGRLWRGEGWRKKRSEKESGRKRLTWHIIPHPHHNRNSLTTKTTNDSNWKDDDLAFFRKKNNYTFPWPITQSETITASEGRKRDGMEGRMGVEGRWQSLGSLQSMQQPVSGRVPGCSPGQGGVWARQCTCLAAISSPLVQNILSDICRRVLQLFASCSSGATRL